ncbi:hypothetical protein [Acinetobacter colistiniresistens]|uniref:hypothetical protein n=1 Tax=Acinetobacter colistiniresistens TaxID=280145 RepID=UPI00125074BD|nr:hypothetical protein [Acinetobacter colistiniresistens]
MSNSQTDRFVVTIQDMFKDFQTAQAVGSAMLASNGVLVPIGFEHIAILIKSFSKPISTNMDPAEYFVAGGLQLSAPSIPKTLFEGSASLIETDTGHATAFAEAMQLAGEMDFILYDGRADRAMRAHKLHKCKMTFDVAEVDSENRSQPMIFNAQMKYNYFGLTSNLGSTGNAGNVIVQANDAMAEFAQKANATIAAIQAGNRVVSAMQSIFK